MSKEVYLYDLSPTITRNLCQILDQNDIWKKLCIEMQYDTTKIEFLKKEKSKGKSPSNELLSEWVNQLNHNVTELFHLLSKLKLYSAMKELRPYVAPEFHQMIHEESDLEQVTKVMSIEIPDATIHVEYNELKEATYNWDTKRILGKGGYGTVYLGWWKKTKVAIKRLHIQLSEQNINLHTELNQSLRELVVLNKYRHTNILSVYGYSVTGEFPCLVYEYLPGNNLDQVLHPKNNENSLSPEAFDWSRRLNVAFGVARGLNFLHTVSDKPLLHGDIKPANILLDSNNQPKIGDFGLARDGPINGYTHIMVSRICGTEPYLPPDFINSGKMSTKVDVFSYGVVILEICTGLNAYLPDPTTRKGWMYLANYILKNKSNFLELIDKRLPCENINIYLFLMRVAVKCVQCRAKNRPEMEEVLEEFCNPNQPNEPRSN